jgi:hypothetical protein
VARKPAVATAYTREEAEQVKAACLTVAAILGDLMEDLCIVGGLVPSMICGTAADPSAIEEGAHCGTTDLDVALSVALLGGERYKEIAERLRARGFGPDENEDGRRTRQRWQWGDLGVTVDFLIPPRPEDPADGGRGARLQSLEADFAALIVRPLHLAFDERIARRLVGRNLQGDRLQRDVPFSGPAAFVAMKAFAYRLRGEPKDAYDLVYVLRRWDKGIGDISERLTAHRERWAKIVEEALEFLAEDFSDLDSAGPRDFARFLTGHPDDVHQADAHGAVTDLLERCGHVAGLAGTG